MAQFVVKHFRVWIAKADLGLGPNKFYREAMVFTSKPSLKRLRMHI